MLFAMVVGVLIALVAACGEASDDPQYQLQVGGLIRAVDDLDELSRVFGEEIVPLPDEVEGVELRRVMAGPELLPPLVSAEYEVSDTSRNLVVVQRMTTEFDPLVPLDPFMLDGHRVFEVDWADDRPQDAPEGDVEPVAVTWVGCDRVFEIGGSTPEREFVLNLVSELLEMCAPEPPA